MLAPYNNLTDNHNRILKSKMNNQNLKNDNSNSNNGQNSYIERSCLLFYLERKKRLVI